MTRRQDGHGTSKTSTQRRALASEKKALCPACRHNPKAGFLAVMWAICCRQSCAPAKNHFHRSRRHHVYSAPDLRDPAHPSSTHLPTRLPTKTQPHTTKKHGDETTRWPRPRPPAPRPPRHARDDPVRRGGHSTVPEGFLQRTLRTTTSQASTPASPSRPSFAWLPACDC